MQSRQPPRHTVAGQYAPPSKPTVIGAAIVATLVTAPFALVALVFVLI
ncbi:hypothetical protein [Tateyamaria sp. 1078]